MSEIPEDLMAKAREVFAELDTPWSYLVGKGSGEDTLRIARALMAERESATLAERERAAGIADDPTRNVVWTPREIAEAILDDYLP
jgi:hypothetical protein